MTTQVNESPVFTAVTLAADVRDFRIETTTVDGHGYAMLICKPCDHHHMNISARIGSRAGDLFRARDLAVLMAVAATRQCPPEVRNAR